MVLVPTCEDGIRRSFVCRVPQNELDCTHEKAFLAATEKIVNDLSDTVEVVILDLSLLQFIDGRGIRVVVRFNNELKTRGVKLRVTGNELVTLRFTQMGLTQLLSTNPPN